MILKEKSEEILFSTLRSLSERIEKSEKFVLDQAPDICKEMVTEGLISISVQFLVNIPIFILLVLLDKHLISSYIAFDGTSGSGDYVLGASLCSLVLFGISIWVFSTIESVLKIKYCPKLYLVREFKNLLVPSSKE
jgi:hypothetical protein